MAKTTEEVLEVPAEETSATALKRKIRENGEKEAQEFIKKNRRGRKPGPKPKKSKATEEAPEKESAIKSYNSSEYAETILKKCIKSDTKAETVRIIEEEIGKDNLIRLAVRYLYSKVGE